MIGRSDRSSAHLPSAERFRLLLEHVPVLIYAGRLVPGVNPVYVSPLIEALLGYSAEEWQTGVVRWGDLIHPADREQATGKAGEYWSGSSGYSDEYRLLARDGRTVWVHDETIMVRDGTGLPMYEQVLLIDITAQKMAADQVQVRAGELETIIERVPSGVIVVDATGRTVLLNRAGRDILQLRPEIHSVLEAQVEYSVLRDHHTGEPIALHDTPIGRALQGETVDSDESLLLLPGKSQYRLIRTSAAPIRDVDGAVSGAVAAFIDVTVERQMTLDLMRSEEALRFTEERYRSLVETSLDGIARLDLGATITFANRALAEILGYDSGEALVGLAAVDIVVPEERERARVELQQLVQRGTSPPVRVMLCRKDGSSFPAEIKAAVTFDTEGRPHAITSFVRDITEARAYEEQLRHQALHDGLTGLPNRTLLGDRLVQSVLAAHRDSEPLGVLIVDLDRFKEVNDTLGHGVGDAVLQQASARFRDVLRESDTVARLGGDEFGVLLSNADEPGAAHAATKLLTSLAEPFDVEGNLLYLGASIGVAVYPEHGADGSTLLRRAEIAMYDAKRSGSGFSIYAEASDLHSAERLALTADLRRAIGGGQFVLHYQPKVHLADDCAEHVEALIRWIHPELGFIPPDRFISLAEHTGLIKPLTNWVLNEALRQLQHWHEDGLDINVAVNLSAWNLQDPRLVDTVAALLKQWGVRPAALTLEITESALMVDPERALSTVTALSTLGVKISIDDFGTGYSSLAYLKRLPVNEIKIDRSFISDIQSDDRGSAVIVDSVIAMGHNLGMQVVGEGVETHDIMTSLAGMGCDVVQGYYVSRPVPPDQYQRWLTDRRAGLTP